MSSVQWVQPGAAVAESAPAPTRTHRRDTPNCIRLEPVDILSILLVVVIIASAIVASVWAVEQYRWEQAAYAAFKARHVNDIVVPPVFDWPGRERFVGQLLGGGGILILELLAGVLLRRHARTIVRGERRERKPRRDKSRHRPAPQVVVVRESFRPAGAGPTSRPAAAERAATVIWGDRVARHEAAPHAN